VAALGAIIAACSGGCGVLLEKDLPVHPPVTEARVSTFGWSRLLGLGQEIWVTLDPGVSPGEVVDLSVFAPFTPGTTHADAVALAGEPVRRSADGDGQIWFEYDHLAGTVEIGCQCVGSGSAAGSSCVWRLFARLNASPEAGLDPQLLGFVTAARAIPEIVGYRTLQVNTANNGEFVSWTVDAVREPVRILWQDRNDTPRGEPCKGA